MRTSLALRDFYKPIGPLIVLFLTCLAYPVFSQEIPIVRFQDLAWSPDGSKIAAASGGEVCHIAPETLDQFAIKIVDAASGAVINGLVGHQCPPTSVAWASDSVRLMSSALDGIRIWDTVTGNVVFDPNNNFVGQQAAYKNAWSPVNNHVATVIAGGTAVMIWDADTGQSVGAVGVQRRYPSTSVAWSPDGLNLVSGGEDGTVSIWNAETGENLYTFQHDGPVYSVAWSPDSSRVASGSRDQTVRIWDTDTGEPLRIMTGHMDLVNAVAWSPDGTRLASGSNDTTVRIWNVETGAQIDLFQATSAVWALAWSPDGSRLAYGVINSGDVTIVTPDHPCNKRQLKAHFGGDDGFQFPTD